MNVKRHLLVVAAGWAMAGGSSACDEDAGTDSPSSAATLPSGSSSLSTSASGSATSTLTMDPSDDPINWADLIAPEAWALADPALDAFADHRPANAECPNGSWRLENKTLEIDTGYCTYALFSQPSLLAVEAGQRIHLVAWHLQLASQTPAIGHMAVQLGDEVLWQVQPAIPGPAAAFDVEVMALRDHPAGSPVVVHLHNHGYNNWSFFQLQRPAL